jgi:SAM-dependent methyltransferase
VAVETGCGTGWFSVELCRRGFRTIGIDTGVESLKIAKRYALENGLPIDYVAANASCPPFLHQSLDFIFAFGALHHLPNLKTSYQFYSELLKPEGLLLFYEHLSETFCHKVVKKIVSLITAMRIRSLRRTYGEFNLQFKTFPSRNEDISLNEIVTVFKVFETLSYRSFKHGFSDLAVVDYFKTGRNIEKTINRTKIYKWIDRINFLFKDNFCLFIGRKRQ